jgi:hypothetical protein
MSSTARAEIPDSQDDLVVYSFPKNAREEIRATLTTFKGFRLADVRVYCADDNGDGDHPTRKGIAVRVEDLPKLLEAVQALLEAERAA